MRDEPTESSRRDTHVLLYAQPSARRRLSPLTVAAITCALIAPLAMFTAMSNHLMNYAVLFPLLAIASVILGAWAGKEEDTSDLSRRIATTAFRFGAAELLLIFLAYVLLPRSGLASERANRTKCASNMQLIGNAIEQYAKVNQGQFPSGLDILLAGRYIEAETFTCPSSNHEMAYGDTLDERVQKFRNSPNHCSVVYLGAGMTSLSVTPKLVIAYEFPQNHSWEGIHVLYGDGKVRWWGKDDAAQIVADLQGGQNPPSVR